MLPSELALSELENGDMERSGFACEAAATLDRRLSLPQKVVSSPRDAENGDIDFRRGIMIWDY